MVDAGVPAVGTGRAARIVAIATRLEGEMHAGCEEFFG